MLGADSLNVWAKNITKAFAILGGGGAGRGLAAKQRKVGLLGASVADEDAAVVQASPGIEEGEGGGWGLLLPGTGTGLVPQLITELNMAWQN